jgi:hypothetical protein
MVHGQRSQNNSVKTIFSLFIVLSEKEKLSTINKIVRNDSNIMNKLYYLCNKK